MKRLNRVQIGLFIGGFLLFIYSIYAFGGSSIDLIERGFVWKYLWIYLALSALSFFPVVWRWQAILGGYNKKIGFWTLLRIQLAGFAVSYVTPSARYGGEPLRIYILKKDCKVDYKTGTASVLLDKYMEYLGAVTFGILGLFLLVISPWMPSNFKWLLFVLMSICVIGVGFIYHRFIKEKGFFFPLFNLFVSEKRIKKMSKVLKDVDSKMSHFMIHKKKAFFLSYIFYVFSAIFFIAEFKFLLLSLGVDTTLLEGILIVIVVGAANLVPLPMAMGSMEAGQVGLFKVLKNDGSIGLIISLVEKAKNILISAIGFLLIMFFGGKKVLKEKEGV